MALNPRVPALVTVACICCAPASGRVVGGRDGGADSPGIDDYDSCDELEPPLHVCADGSAGYASVAAAVSAAPEGCTITVCPGTYRERIEVTDKPVYILGTGGAEATHIESMGGDTVIARGVPAPGVTLAGLTLHGGGDASGRAVRCVDSDLRLRAAVVRDGRASEGGGLWAHGCALDIVDTAFVHNDGGEQGGGALITASTGALVDSEVHDNIAVQGGGIAVLGGEVELVGLTVRDNAARLHGGGIYLRGDTVVRDSTLEDNASEWTGGGIYVDGHAPTMVRVSLSRNTAVDDGGGVYLHQSEATLSECRIQSNESGDDGGGIRAFESAALMERNHVEGNHAADGGGGIRVSHVPSRLIDNDVIGNTAGGAGGGYDLDNDSSHVSGGRVVGNWAPRGGGVHIYLWPWNDGLLEDIEIRDNRANRGGGLYLENNFQLVTLRDLRVTGNTAERGGGLSSRTGALLLQHSVFAHNRAESTGGGVEIGGDGPWTDPPFAEPCPCPPTEATGTASFVVIAGNEANAGAGLWIDSPYFAVSSSIVADHAGSAVQSVGAPPAWSYNDTYPNEPTSMVGVESAAGAGNLAVPPEFAGDYQLAASSPCRDAGDPAFTDSDGTRADMGVYGGR